MEDIMKVKSDEDGKNDNDNHQIQFNKYNGNTWKSYMTNLGEQQQ